MNQPLIIITGRPAWLAALDATAYNVQSIEQREGYVALLADQQAALILVDGDAAGWRYWAATAKSSPATRRIPLLVVTADSAQHEAAQQAGADAAIHPAEISAAVSTWARVPDPAELDCACAGPLPPRALEGVERFNAGDYYAQHDLFEAQWVETEGPVRDLYRAVLQVGVAYYQIERGNHRGALKMLLRSVQWLARLPDVCQGIDVKQLREDSAQVRAALENMRPEDIAHFDRSLLKPVRLRP